MDRASPEAHARGGVLDAGLVVRGYLDAGDRDTPEALRSWLDDDLVVHGPGGSALGVDAQVASWRAARRGLADLHHEVEDLLVVGDLVAARIVVSGVHTGAFLGIPPTGRAIRVDQALFARVRAGRIVELWEVVDTGSGLQQLGALQDRSLAP